MVFDWVRPYSASKLWKDEKIGKRCMKQWMYVGMAAGF